MELPNLSGTPAKSTPPEGDVTKTTQAQKTDPVVKEAVPAVPTAFQKPISSSILPGTKLTKEEKKKLLEIKEEIKKKLQLIKRIIAIVLVLSLGWFAWLQINLSETNSFLSVFGINENLGQKVRTLEKETSITRLENNKIEKNIQNIEKQLNDKSYTRHSKVIQEIRSQQLHWYDEIDAEGNQIFGITDAVPRMQDYFNSRDYSDPDSVLSGKHSDIEIKNLQVSRNEVNFSVISAQILGKVFFLNIEFIEMLNSFPFLKSGKLTQFSRQVNKDGDDSMSFSVRLQMQAKDEIDPADDRFNEYLNWLNPITKE